MSPEAKIVVGVFFLLLGTGTIYRPDLIHRLIRFIRDYLLNDARMALQRRQWGIFFLLLSLLFIYMGYTGLQIPR